MKQKNGTKNNKDAFSLIEVMVAVSLIVTVIAAVLKMQQNNIFFLEKFKNSSLNNTYISLIANEPNPQNLRNESIRVGDKVRLDDDDLRRELKNIKLKVKEKRLDDIKLPENDYIKEAQVYESSYTVDNMNKKFFIFKLQ